jgi:DNA polymerase-3 subunit epsilon
MRQIFVSIESTGLFANNGDRIVEIDCVEMINHKLTGNDRHYYINPERDSDQGALSVHGLSSDFLRVKPKFVDIVDEFLTYASGAEFCSKSPHFDLPFLNAELKRLGKPKIEELVSSVMVVKDLAKKIFPNHRNSLEDLRVRLQISNEATVLRGVKSSALLLAHIYSRLRNMKH